MCQSHYSKPTFVFHFSVVFEEIVCRLLMSQECRNEAHLRRGAKLGKYFRYFRNSKTSFKNFVEREVDSLEGCPSSHWKVLPAPVCGGRRSEQKEGLGRRRTCGMPAFDDEKKGKSKSAGHKNLHSNFIASKATFRFHYSKPARQAH